MEVTLNLIAFVGALVAFGLLLVIIVFCLTRIHRQLMEAQSCLDSMVIMLARQCGMSIMLDGEEVEDLKPLIFGNDNSEGQKDNK